MMQVWTGKLNELQLPVHNGRTDGRMEGQPDGWTLGWIQYTPIPPPLERCIKTVQICFGIKTGFKVENEIEDQSQSSQK